MASVFVIFSQNVVVGMCCTELLPSNTRAAGERTHARQGDHISVLLFFQNNGSRQKNAHMLVCVHMYKLQLAL
jgi:hypothetical protein